jgi:hypothetical protein
MDSFSKIDYTPLMVGIKPRFKKSEMHGDLPARVVW